MKRRLQRFGMLMAMVMLIVLGIPSVLSADAQIPRKEAGLQSFPVEATTQIYKGAMVCTNAAGYLAAAADTAGYKFQGIAYENVLGTTQGAKNCRVHTSGVFKLPATSITQAMVGQLMYVTDDGTIDDTSTNFVCCGRLVEYVSATSGWVDIGQRGLTNDSDLIRLVQTTKGIGSGLDINRISVINTAGAGERTRVLQIALTGQAATEMGGGECFRSEITLSTGMSLAASAGLIGHYGWIEIEDGVAIGDSALITPFRSVIYAHDNDLSAIGGGGESALFYGQTWGIDSGTIGHGVRIVAGAGTFIGDLFGAVGGEGAIKGSILDFLGLYDEDTNVCLAQWPLRDTHGGGRPVRWWMGRAVTREDVFLEMNARETVDGYAVHGRGTLYFSVNGEIYMKVAQSDAQGDWEVLNHQAADTG